MTHSLILFFFSLSFILGIFFASFFSLSPFSLILFFNLAIFLILFFWEKRRVVLFGFCLIFLLLGFLRMETFSDGIKNNELLQLNDSAETINLEGRVAKEAIEKIKVEMIVFQPDNYKGKILIVKSLYPHYEYGDRIKVTGKLKTPENTSGFDYRQYLLKDGIYSIMEWPKITLVKKNDGSILFSAIIGFKKKFEEATRQFISPPEEGLLEALLFGDESEISNEWENKFNITGTRHITAVSGMNVTIISFLVFAFLLNVGLWRQQAFFLSLFFIFLYVLMVGAPSSAVRAGIMAVIVLIGQYFGRLSSGVRALVFVAVLMLFFNPLLLKTDLGFQLSFLAMLGIILYVSFFIRWLKIIPETNFFPLRTTIATVLAAQFFTFPLLIYNFGYISSVTVLTNILIIPLIAPLTIFIFLFGVIAMLSYSLGYVFSFFVWPFLSYIIFVIDFFSRLSFNVLNFQQFSSTMAISFLFITYFILGIITWFVIKKQENQFLK